MGFIEEGRQTGCLEDPVIRAIEERIAAAELHMDALLEKRGIVQTPPENSIDRNHAEILDALRRREEALRNDILRRLERVESKLQNVA